MPGIVHFAFKGINVANKSPDSGKTGTQLAAHATPNHSGECPGPTLAPGDGCGGEAFGPPDWFRRLRNTVFDPSREKFHAVVSQGVRHMSGALERPPDIPRATLHFVYFSPPELG